MVQGSKLWMLSLLLLLSHRGVILGYKSSDGKSGDSSGSVGLRCGR
jgi:hypothetical protein